MIISERRTLRWFPSKANKDIREESRIHRKSLVYSETKQFAVHSIDHSLLVNQRTLGGWLGTQKGAANQNVAPLTITLIAIQCSSNHHQLSAGIGGGVLRRFCSVGKVC